MPWPSSRGVARSHQGDGDAEQGRGQRCCRGGCGGGERGGGHGCPGAELAGTGIAGFFVTGFGDFAGHTDKTLLGFEINPLHNIVHLAIGLAGIALSRTMATARTYGWLLAVGYGATFVFGLFAAGRTDAVNFLSPNAADNWLHLVSTLAGLAIALWPVRHGASNTR